MARRDRDDEDDDRGRDRDRESDRGRDRGGDRGRDDDDRGSRSRSRDRDDDDRDSDRGRGRDRGRSDSSSDRGSKRNDEGSKATEVRLENVRLSYPKLFRPEAFQGEEGGEKKYGAAFIIDPKTQGKLIDACERAIDDAKYAKWGDKQPSIKASKLALREGDEDRDDPAYEGKWYVQTSSTRRPQVVDRDRSPLVEEDGKPYAGCYVNAIVRFWAQDNKWGKRVNASLEAVQFYKDGDAFGAAPIDTDKAFDAYDDDDDDDRDRGRGRGRDRDRSDDRKSSRDRDRDDDRGSDRRSSRSRDRDDDDRDERFERGRR